MRSRALVYFGSLLATIALINTPLPRVVVSAVLNPEAGDAVARSLGSITKDLVLVLLISLYFEWVRTKEQGALLRCMDRKLDALQAATAPATRKLVLDATTPEELVTTALDRHIQHSGDKPTFVSLVTVHVGFRYEVTMPRGPVLVAVTSSPTHPTALSDARPELFHVSTPPWPKVHLAADRPMSNRTLTMDMRELVRDQGKKVHEQVFLGSVDSLMLDAEDEGHLSLRLDRWVVQGQGVVAVW